MSEWSQTKSIEMLVSRVEHSLNINNTYNNLTIFCDLLNIARGRCEIIFKKAIIGQEKENNLFISSKKPIMKAIKTLDNKEYDQITSNIYNYSSFKIKKIKIMLFIENPIAINNLGFLNIEKDLNIKVLDFNFSIPIF